MLNKIQKLLIRSDEDSAGRNILRTYTWFAIVFLVLFIVYVVSDFFQKGS
jgi:hypothetical protein